MTTKKINELALTALTSQDALEAYLPISGVDGLSDELQRVRLNDLKAMLKDERKVVPHKYWRVLFAANNSATFSGLAELMFYEAGKVISATITNPGTAISNGGDATLAFNNDLASGWNVSGAAGSWLGYNFNVPVGIIRVRLVSALFADQSPRDFSVQFSDDGSTWTTAWSVTNQTGWNNGDQRQYVNPSPAYLPAAEYVTEAPSDTKKYARKGKAWVETRDVPTGGAKGQVLTKSTNAEGDVAWMNADGPQAVVNGRAFSSLANRADDTLTLGFTPKVGNLLLVCMGTNGGVNQEAGWTKTAYGLFSGWHDCFTLYRYVDTPDTTTIKLNAADSQTGAAIVFEIDKDAIADPSNPLAGIVVGASDNTTPSFVASGDKAYAVALLGREANVVVNGGALLYDVLPVTDFNASNREAAGVYANKIYDGDTFAVTYTTAAGVYFALTFDSLGSVNRLSSLKDVDVTTVVPIDGQALVYDYVRKKFVPGSNGGGGSFIDAPEDGKQYARQDGAWTVVVAGSGGGGGGGGDTPLDPVSAFGEHLYWAVNSTSTNNAGYVGWAECAMFSVPGGQNQCVGGIAASNTGTVTGAIANGFDGDPATTFASGGVASRISYQFLAPVNIQEIDITAWPSRPNEAPVNFVVQYSDDGIVWSNAWIVAGTADWTAGEKRKFVDPTLVYPTEKLIVEGGDVSSYPKTPYWRIHLREGGLRALSSVEFRTTKGASSLPVGGVASASSAYDGSADYRASNAFDGNSNTFWNSAAGSEHWIAYTFAQPIVVREVMIQPRNDSFSDQAGPHNFNVEYSLDGSTWLVFFSRDNEPAWSIGDTRLYTNPEPETIIHKIPDTPAELGATEEAPKDNKAYARRNGGWTKAVALADPASPPNIRQKAFRRDGGALNLPADAIVGNTLVLACSSHPGTNPRVGGAAPEASGFTLLASPQASNQKVWFWSIVVTEGNKGAARVVANDSSGQWAIYELEKGFTQGRIVANINNTSPVLTDGPIGGMFIFGFEHDNTDLIAVSTPGPDGVVLDYTVPAGTGGNHFGAFGHTVNGFGQQIVFAAGNAEAAFAAVEFTVSAKDNTPRRKLADLDDIPDSFVGFSGALVGIKQDGSGAELLKVNEDGSVPTPHGRHKFWRIVMTVGSFYNAYSCAEMNFLTDPNAPPINREGIIAETNSGGNPALMLDGDLGSFVDSNGNVGNTTWTFTFPTPQGISSFVYTPRTGSPDQFPRGYTIQFSDDKNAWVDAWSALVSGSPYIGSNPVRFDSPLISNLPTPILIPRYLDAMKDVTAPAPADGEVLTWDDATDQWVPRARVIEAPNDGRPYWRRSGTWEAAEELGDIKPHRYWRLRGTRRLDGDRMLTEIVWLREDGSVISNVGNSPDAPQVFDGSIYNYVQNDVATFVFDVAQPVAGVTSWGSPDNAWVGRNPIDFVIEFSDDGANWLLAWQVVQTTTIPAYTSRTFMDPIPERLPLATYTEEAPEDGRVYVRSDGEWAELNLPKNVRAFRFWGAFNMLADNPSFTSINEFQFRLSSGGGPIPGGTPYATPAYPGYPLSQAFDGGNEFYAAAQGNIFLYIDYGAPVVVAELAIKSRNTANETPRSGVIRGSNDGVNWVDICPLVFPAWGSNEFKTLAIPVISTAAEIVPEAPKDGTAYVRKDGGWANAAMEATRIQANAPGWRMRSLGAAMTGTSVGVGEVSFMADGVALPLTGGAPVASSVYDNTASYQAANAFDGNPATAWYSAQGASLGAAIGYKFANAVAPDQVKITTDANFPKGCTLSFAVDYQIEDGSWQQVALFVALPWDANPVQTFNIPRINAVISGDGSSGAGGSGGAPTDVPYIIPVFTAYSPEQSETLMDHMFVTPASFPANFTGSLGSTGTAPASTYTISIQKNGVAVGTIVANTDKTMVFATNGAGSVSFAVGDILSVICPASADLSIARIRFSLIGTRN